MAVPCFLIKNDTTKPNYGTIGTAWDLSVSNLQLSGAQYDPLCVCVCANFSNLSWPSLCWVRWNLLNASKKQQQKSLHLEHTVKRTSAVCAFQL